MPRSQLRTAIHLADPDLTDLGQSPGYIVQKLSIGAGILVPEGNPSAGRHPGYLFLHRTVAEHLVARHLAALPSADWLEVVDQHLWFDPDWAEVIPLLGGLLDPDSARRLVQHLLGQADDPFDHALLTAVRVISERPDPDDLLPAGHLHAMADAVFGLIDHPATRQTVASILAAIPRLPPLIVDGLLARLDASDLDVRRAVVKALADRDTRAVTDGLLARLDAREPSVRRAAIGALAGRNDPQVTDGLLGRLGDPDRDVRRAAIGALASRDDPQVTGELLGRLGDPDWWVRRAVVDALAGRDDPQVTGELLGRLGDPDRWVREAAVGALAGRDDPQVTVGCWPASATRTATCGGRWWTRWPAGTTRRSPSGCWPASATRTATCGGRSWTRWPVGTTRRSPMGCWAASATRTGGCGRRRWRRWPAGTTRRSPANCWPALTTGTGMYGGRR